MYHSVSLCFGSSLVGLFLSYSLQMEQPVLLLEPFYSTHLLVSDHTDTDTDTDTDIDIDIDFLTGSYEFFRIGYVYGLLIACFVVLFLIPAVIFPRASNIFSSSFIGGYLVVYSIGIFVWTTIDQIVLKVVRVASIKDYLSFHEAYPFTLNGINNNNDNNNNKSLISLARYPTCWWMGCINNIRYHYPVTIGQEERSFS